MMEEDGCSADYDESGLRLRRRFPRWNVNEEKNNASNVGEGIASSDLVAHSSVQQQQRLQQRQQQGPDSSIVPLSMQLLRPFYLLSYCPSCNSMHGSNDNFAQGNIEKSNNGSSSNSSRSDDDFFAGNKKNMGRIPVANNNLNSEIADFTARENSSSVENNNNNIASKPSNATPRKPTMELETTTAAAAAVTVEQILQEYTTYTHTYGCSSRLNAGILATFRFSLPTLRVSGSFFDADMLALCEVLLRHCNGYLSYIKRLDFTLASKEGRDIMSMAGNNGRYYGAGVGGGGGGGKKGVRSHGAYALSKVLTISQHIEEVYLNGNRIGSYGSSAIFLAASQNTTLRTLLLRGCRIGERGAVSFAHQICGKGSQSGLREVDLSACRIGFRGCYVIEEMLKKKREVWKNNNGMMMVVDLEGNMVFQEVRNDVLSTILVRQFRCI